MNTVDQNQIVELTRNVWMSMLGMELMEIENSRFELTRQDGRFLSACVQITGAWTGAVRLDCTQGFAEHTAAAFLGTDRSSVAREHVLDALGEAANMVAGSIKPLLPRPCHISLPSIVDGEDYEFSIQKVRREVDCDFENGNDFLKVSLFQRVLPE